MIKRTPAAGEYYEVKIMGYYASASGSATIIDGKKAELEKILEDKYGKYAQHCSLDYDFFEDKDGDNIEITDSEKYHEEDTMEFLKAIAPYITEGCLDYSGEDDCIWRFVFNPETKKWKEENATIDYNFESYSDERLITELEKRGYMVSKSESGDVESLTPKESDGITVYKDLDHDTPVSICSDKLRVDWYNAGEGVSGDYDPEDPEDVNLLRFDVYAKTDDPSWEDTDGWTEVDDASYCTQVPADTDPEELERLLRVIFDRYNDVIDDYIENGTSVKKLGEELSWIAPKKQTETV